jgi:hypothetical protein
MNAGTRAGCNVSPIVDQHAGLCATDCCADCFSKLEYVASGEVALANLHHINSGGCGASGEINQGSQFLIRCLDAPVGYHVDERRRAVSNRFHVPTPSETCGRSF